MNSFVTTCLIQIIIKINILRSYRISSRGLQYKKKSSLGFTLMQSYHLDLREVYEIFSDKQKLIAFATTKCILKELLADHL